MDVFQKRVSQLSQMSIDKHQLAFNQFDWPSKISDNDWWFSPSALSIIGSEKEKTFDEIQKKKIAKWECINFFSLNYTGELELIQEVSRILNQVNIGEARNYLHHLIDEENQHMWYFNRFCQRYVGKVYPNKKFQLEKQKLSKEVDHFLVFARVLIFEEIGHYFNIKNAKDPMVHPFIREINQAHYSEEARHITFGRKVLLELSKQLPDESSCRELIREELIKSIQINIGALYNPLAYKDAGIERGMMLRESLLTDRGRMLIHMEHMLPGVLKILMQCQIDLEGFSI